MAKMRIEQTLEVLRTRIHDAAARSDLRLPPEVELAGELGVGRSTLREALALLEAEGVVHRARSRGTFIRPSALQYEQEVLSYPVDLILSFADYLTAHSIPFTIENFSFGRETLPENNGTQSDFAGQEVYRTWRVFRVRNHPAAYLEHVVPVAFGNQPVQPSLLLQGVTALFDALTDVQLESIDNSIGAELSDERLSGLLDVKPGSALVVMNARLFGMDSALLGTGRLVFRPDILTLSVRASSRINIKAR